MKKYTKELLEAAVKESVSLAGVLRKLGNKWSGGAQQNIKRRIKEFNIDTSHFLGMGANRGKGHKGGPAKRHWSTLLVENQELTWRLTTAKLRRAFLEYGAEYKCQVCNNTGEWLGKKLNLQIDHIDNNWKNNKPDNLRFICPNCHTQKNV